VTANVDSVLGLLVLPAVVFALVYAPLIARVSSGLISPYPKADVRKRLYADAIDGTLIVMSTIVYQRFESLPFLILGAAYLLLRDGVRGQSVGKWLLGLVVINLERGRPATMSASVKRNIMLIVPGANLAAVPLEILTLMRDVQGQRLGDRLAQTQVVEGLGAKDFVDEFQRWWQRVAGELARSGRRGALKDPFSVEPWSGRN
jgi:uncharacterized RDD family membrane protein YckC